MGLDILDRMERAVAEGARAVAAGDRGPEFVRCWDAVVGGNAVASWVATVDEGAVPHHPRRRHSASPRRSLAVTAAPEARRIVRDEVMDVVMFRDGPEGKPSEAVHLLFAGEKTRPDHHVVAPEIPLRERSGQLQGHHVGIAGADEANVELPQGSRPSR